MRQPNKKCTAEDPPLDALKRPLAHTMAPIHAVHEAPISSPEAGNRVLYCIRKAGVCCMHYSHPQPCSLKLAHVCNSKAQTSVNAHVGAGRPQWWLELWPPRFRADAAASPQGLAVEAG
jgi:hypothetical protein